MPIVNDQQRQRLVDFLADPDLDEEREILEAPPVPLEPQLEARLVDAALREAAPPVAGGGQAAIPEPPRRASSLSAPDELAARRSRSRRFIPWIGGLSAVAAAAVLVLRNPTGELPAYRIEASGKADVLSDKPAGEVHIAPHAKLEITLRPARRGPDDAVIQSYLRRGDTYLRWNLVLRRTGANGFHVSLPYEEIPDIRDIQPGNWQAVFIIGHESHMPAESEIDRLIRDESATSPDVRIRRLSVVVERP